MSQPIQARNFEPCSELVEVLRGAYSPCANLKGGCVGIARWDPRAGYVPRGYVGAFGSIQEVELVLVVAEPGDPFGDQPRGIPRPGNDRLQVMGEWIFDLITQGTSEYHRNLRHILNLCWPKDDLYTQLRKTWITESFLCSAPQKSGPVPARAWKGCVDTYLTKQLALLEGRVVVALGTKASTRMRGIPNVIGVAAAAPPGANFSGARESWAQIPKLLLARRRSISRAERRAQIVSVPQPD